MFIICTLLIKKKANPILNATIMLSAICSGWRHF